MKRREHPDQLALLPEPHVPAAASVGTVPKPGTAADSNAPLAKRDKAEASLLLSPIDHQFANLMARLSGGNPDVRLAAALVSYYRSLGHICLDLSATDWAVLASIPAELGLDGLPKAAHWLRALGAAPVVGRPGEFKPLVLDEAGRLYLHRYWKYEADVAAVLKRLAAQRRTFDPATVKSSLRRLSAKPVGGDIDWQMVAAFAALRKQLCVISGGPGTGKTRTVVLLLALLLEEADRQENTAPNEASGGQCRIALAAPTGKAAARLQETLKSAKAGLNISEKLKARLPDEAATIHRLLGALPSSAYFRHDASNPLPYDIVVIDEASMIDLALMAKLVTALPEHAQLILLGDKDQLASVEAGAVLADICNAGTPGSLPSHFAAEYEAVTGQRLPGVSDVGVTDLSDCVIELRKNYRFGEAGEIYKLSQLVNSGKSRSALELLRSPSKSDAGVSSRPLPGAGLLKNALRPMVVEHFGQSARTTDPVESLERLARFRILCALRAGPYGVETINRLVQEILIEDGRVQAASPFYAGRPVIIRRNDYNLKLYNGDIGILLPECTQKELRAWFHAPDGTVRSFLPLRLPEHETAYALTVHKSQGSEFERILLILPADPSPVVTRELVYTGITRAINHVEIWFTPETFVSSVESRISRNSGLRDALWPTPSTPINI